MRHLLLTTALCLTTLSTSWASNITTENEQEHQKDKEYIKKLTGPLERIEQEIQLFKQNEETLLLDPTKLDVFSSTLKKLMTFKCPVFGLIGAPDQDGTLYTLERVKQNDLCSLLPFLTDLESSEMEKGQTITLTPSFKTIFFRNDVRSEVDISDLIQDAVVEALGSLVTDKSELPDLEKTLNFYIRQLPKTYKILKEGDSSVKDNSLTDTNLEGLESAYQTLQEFQQAVQKTK